MAMGWQQLKHWFPKSNVLLGCLGRFDNSPYPVSHRGFTMILIYPGNGGVGATESDLKIWAIFA